MKFDPQIIDDFARKLPHVLDVATARLDRGVELPDLAIAVVASDEFSMASFEQELRAQFPDRFPTIYAEVESIPRNQMRKVMRQEIAAKIMMQLEK